MALNVDLNLDNIDMITYAVSVLCEKLPFKVCIMQLEEAKRLELVQSEFKEVSNKELLPSLVRAMDQLLVGRVVLERAMEKTQGRLNASVVNKLTRHFWHYWNQMSDCSYSPPTTGSGHSRQKCDSSFRGE